jgi:hypothetical protein
LAGTFGRLKATHFALLIIAMIMASKGRSTAKCFCYVSYVYHCLIYLYAVTFDLCFWNAPLSLIEFTGNMTSLANFEG